ncbi:glycoside hydrolase superfamily [Truncatella angustata]|uniref:Alpha-galactosidase n=1 Tax=Truncatella angustata TaxID=152316 RepID=A0A9P8U8Q3_9PEZI|nr:glycoside hydrolase superfamily [Truncatella angustata]KAH6645439.1 glycoside hydrolase superfamily [Truncatella angustata]
MQKTALVLVSAIVGLAEASVNPDGTGRLPAMGWNSWNEYSCNISDQTFVNTADLLVSLGLKDLGYQYVNIDDCWSFQGGRDNATQRIMPDPVKFPNGIKNVADEVHAKGMKLGIYGDAGTQTCGGYPGSLGFEAIDAEAFAEWGIDYLKYDNCYVPDEWVDVPQMYPDNGGTPDGYVPLGYDWSTSNSSKRYMRMHDALAKQNRTIQYSLCIWGHANVVTWGNKTGHSWRMFSDIYPSWTGSYEYSQALMPILNQAAFYANVSDFWGHNDWDMLEVGNGNLTIEENRSHFVLWAALKSPLIIGTKLDSIQDEVLTIFKNKEIIAFNQDPVYGKGVVPYKWDGVGNATHPANYWAGNSVRGVHTFMLNTKEVEEPLTAIFAEIPGLKDQKSQPYLVHDMWSGKDLGIFKGSFTTKVKRHDTAALRITKADGTHPIDWQRD